MTALSDLLNSSLPEGWTTARVVEAIDKLPDSQLHIHRATIYNYFKGDHAADPEEHVLRAFAAVLPVSVGDLRDAAQVPRGEDEPWHPPPQASRLTYRQRQAFDELIRSFTGPVAEQPSERALKSVARKRQPRKGDEPKLS